MKRSFLFFSLLLFFFSIVKSQQISLSDTKGELTVNGMGAANYKVPIALPPGVKDVAPQIALTYSSSANNGIAGYGWNIVGISSITRMGTRIDLDGYVDGVDFDENDQFALDGQRLIRENRGVSGGVLFYTENYTNLRIMSYGSFAYPGSSGSGPERFEITFPDGTQAFYGSTTNSRGVSEWLIDKWIDPQGNSIKYEYSTNNNVTYIKKITWSENASIGSNEYFNTIEFFYKSRLRPEMAYLHGVKMTNSRLLDYIEVRAGGSLFRKYRLTHIENELKYQNISKIQEFNGNNEPANPIVFDYESSGTGIYLPSTPYVSVTNNMLYDVKLTGDFDGNGEADFISDNKLYLNPIESNNSWSSINLSGFHQNDIVASVSTLKSNKMAQKNSIMTIWKNKASVTLGFYSYNNNQVVQDFTKYLTLSTSDDSSLYVEEPMNVPGYVYCDLHSATPIVNPEYKKRMKSVQGDFNGDGVTEALIIHYEKEYHIREVFGCENYGAQVDWKVRDQSYYDGEKFYMIDLNPNSSTDVNSQGVALVDNSLNSIGNIGDYSFVFDFNGDGKDDIIFGSSNGNYKVITFNYKTSTPYVVPELLWQGTFSEGNAPLQRAVFGDYNGDGKTDMMIPHNDGGSNWSMYISKGNEFEKVIYNDFMLYQPVWNGSATQYRRKMRQYRSVDLNKDGKSDFLMNEYESVRVGINNRDGRTHINFKKNLGLDSNGKIVFGTIEHAQVDSEYGYNEGPNDPMHLLIGDYGDDISSFNFAIVQGNQIWKGNYKQDQSKDMRLSSVSEVGGKILSEITYAPLKPNMSNGGLGDVNGTYFSSNQENYPFVEIKQLPNFNVVTKLKVSALGKSKEKEFKYFGLTSHSHGWGILGFKKIAQSSWVTSGISTKIWQVNQISPSLRGAVTESWSFSGNNLNLIANPTENQLLSKKTASYFSHNFTNKRYVLLPQVQTEKDLLTGVTKITTDEFDNYYNLKKSSLQIVGTNASYVSNYEYENHPIGIGANYYIGRLKKKNSVSIAYGDTRTSEVKYTYTGNLLTKVETKGHNTDYITETYAYDGYGNVIQTTTSAPGVSSRTISNEYDNNGRFVKKKTDADGLITDLTYNKLGQVLTITDPFNVTTTSSYDHWGKLLTVTVSGASTTPIVTTNNYSRDLNGVLIITSDNAQTKEYSETHTDVLGRTFKTVTKGFAPGTKIAKTTEYDFLGRVIRESEPYFTLSTPTQWNTIEYDNLSRPVKQTAFTGKTTNISYNGLSVTTSENGKTKTVTKDAIGNVASVADNGQVLNYNYYANNELKSTTYGSHIVTIGIDGWGRKTSLLDPSVSSTPYTYAYNNYGELLEEITPNGVTNYSYLPTGKLDYKTITGDNTDIIAYYSYTDKGLIETESGTSGGQSYSTAYEYDSFYRLKKKTETQGIPFSVIFEKEYQYDSYGRVNKEITNSSAYTTPTTLVESSVSVNNHYNAYNGLLDHITDAASGATIWKLTGANARMQTLSAQLGNGVNIANTYTTFGYIQNIRHTKSSITPLSLNYTFNAQKGTLTNRKNNFYNYTENFTYDNFDRLLSWTTPAGTQSNTYETDGRIKTGSEVGNYSYDSAAKYKKNAVALNSAGHGYFIGRTPQAVIYNAFKKPVSITEANRGTIEFDYDIYGVRSRSVEWITDEPSGNMSDIARTKFYSRGSDVEILQKGAAGSSNHPRTRIITYIGGNAYSAPAMFVTDYTTLAHKTEGYHYLHRDFQGSIMAITNQVGNVIERRHYDAWGNISKFTNSLGATQTNPDFIGGEMFFDRGYTGHEHFFRVGIIHMNGRIYDPVLKGFMSPDNFVQDPQNSQNFNRYAYCMNNPLMYTDPSGELWGLSAVASAAIIGAIIGGAVYTGVALYTDTFSWGGLFKSVAIGALSGVATSGIGTMANTFLQGSTGFWATAARESLRAVFHGYSQGFISGISGGDIGQGFVSGMASSVVSSVSMGINAAAGLSGTAGDVSTMLFGSASGGLSSKLAGGNFWEGAAIGLTVSGLNHVAHKMSGPGDDELIKKLTPEQRKQLEQIKSGTQLTTETLQKTGLDKVLDNWIENTALGKNLKVGVVDYLSMGGEIYYDHKLQQYNGISKNEFTFRFVTKATSGLTSAHFGSLAGAAIGAEYGATVGGLVGTVVGAGVGFYIENTYWRGIKYFNNFMQRMDGYIQRQVIFNARRGF